MHLISPDESATFHALPNLFQLNPSIVWMTLLGQSNFCTDDEVEVQSSANCR